MSPVHDYVIDNSTGANVRSDINSVLQAILSNNSNSSAPSTTAAYMWWADTTNGVLKIRNSANNAWVELFQLDGTLTLEDGSDSAPALAFRDDLNTGIFSSGADIFNISTGGVERCEISSSGVVFNDVGSDVDFRIEGDTDTNLFKVDAGTEKIGIGIAAPDRKLHISDSDAEVLKITSTAAGTTGATIELQHNSASPAADDFIGIISTSANDSAGNNTLMSKIQTQFTSVTDGTETAAFSVSLRGLNSYNETLRVIGRGSASAPTGSLANASTNGLIVDVYNDGNPYPRHVILCAKGGGDTDSDLQFWTEAVGGNPTKKMVVEHDGNVTITDGNLIVASGHGIDFSATGDGSGTGTSELLDDYEEGTWSPAFIPASGTFATYVASTSAFYVKVGRLVNVWCQIHVTSLDITGGSSSIRINGLPYTAATGNGIDGGTMNVNYYNNFQSMGDQLPSGYVANNTNFIVMIKIGGNAQGAFTVGNLGTTNFYMHMSYYANQ